MVDLEKASRPVSPVPRIILQVIDAPFDGRTPQPPVVFNFDDDIARGMRSLPPHTSGTARILDVTVHSDFVITGLRDTKGPQSTRPARDALISYLEDTYTQPFEERRIFRWLSDPLPVNDIGSISSQWSQELGGGNANLYRLVNRTSLQHHPLDYDLHPRDSYLTCAQDTNNRLIVVIVNDVWSEQSFGTSKSPESHILFQNPRSISKMLEGKSWTSLSNGTLETFAKLLVLDFFLASIYLQPVDYYGDLIYPKLPQNQIIKFSLTKNPHLQVPLGLFEPRLSAKSREAFHEIEDAEGILRNVNNLVDSIIFVLDALKQKGVTGSRPLNFKKHQARLQQLRSLCTERRSNADRALQALNRQLDYLSKRHAIREAKSIKILTILASFYLPLSLAATLLGMQSPFKKIANAKEQDLSKANLLFDFFGVFIVLATASLFILHTIRIILWLRSSGLGMISTKFSGPFSIFHYGSHWRFDGWGGWIFDKVRVVTRWWIGAGLCVTLMVIFLVGMLRTAQNAWDTARWMFAAYILGGGLLTGGYLGLYWYLYSKTLRIR